MTTLPKVPVLGAWLKVAQDVDRGIYDHADRHLQQRISLMLSRWPQNRLCRRVPHDSNSASRLPLVNTTNPTNPAHTSDGHNSEIDLI